MKHLRPAVAQRLIFKAANKEINSNVIKDLIESAISGRSAMWFSHYLCLIVEEMKSIAIGLFLIIMFDLHCPHKIFVASPFIFFQF